MKNINEILKDLGIEVPEDKTAELQKLVAENYKTVAEFDKKVGRVETERVPPPTGWVDQNWSTSDSLILRGSRWGHTKNRL